MENYERALVAFEMETNELYLDYVMGTFMATEGVGSSVALKVKNGWETIKGFFRKIKEIIITAANGIATAAQKLVNIIKRCPGEMESDDPEVVEFMKYAVSVLDDDAEGMVTVEKLTERLLKLSAELTQKSCDINASLDDIERTLKEFEQVRVEYEKRYTKLTKNSKATDSFTAATEAEGRRFNIQGILNRLHRNSKKVDAQAKANKQNINKVEDAINQCAKEGEGAAGEGDSNAVEHQTRKQQALSKILRFFSMVGSFIKSIPSKISGLFSKLMSFRSKAKVEDYDGPSPVIG
jgi:hypothetical protein